ncbi:MAG: LysE family transporter [Alphaproteobacteria bacterium]|jgi:threonine/homoserine/homoserine lactone efflux protein|nr:LysE family transporter [Alphaproteobacteria bacterium]
MSYELLTAFVTFAFVASITPGPNNLMLMASGANFGWRRTVPHLLGVSLGHGFLVLVLGLGLARVFEAYPLARTLLTVPCAAYLVFLAWKIAHAAPPEQARAEGKPLTFLQAAAFQWVNPKAVYMGITAQTTYAPENGGWVGAMVIAGVFICVNIVSVNTWAMGGTQVRRWLADPFRLRVFNWTMAALLLLTLVPILAELA